MDAHSKAIDLQIRSVEASDAAALRRLLDRVAVFEAHEIAVAEELIAESLAGSRDYAIHVAEDSGLAPEAPPSHSVVGYVCYGHNPVTDALYDLYWIAVDPAAQGQGIGRALIAHTEAAVRGRGGRGILIETSSRNEYSAARRLYERCGYRKSAEIADFYKPGDGLLMYLKFL